MSEGRLFAFMDRLHGRTSAVRRKARDEERDLDELLARTEEASDLRLNTSAGETELEDVRPVPADVPEPGATAGGGFVLVRGEDEIEGPKVVEEARNVELEAITDESSSVETEPEVECTSCGATCEGTPHIGDGGFLCNDCSAEQRRGSKQAATGWQEENLDTLSEIVLRTLEEVYPESQSARDLVDRLMDAGLSPEKVDKTEVNSRLYRDVSDWVEHTDDTPPLWQLCRKDQSAEVNNPAEELSVSPTIDSEEMTTCTGCGDAVTRQQYRSENGLLCERCALSRRSAIPANQNWRTRSLSGVSRLILGELTSVYPVRVTAEGLANRIQGLGGWKSEITDEAVIAKLKGPLNRYVRTETDESDEGPVWWSLMPEAAPESRTEETPPGGSSDRPNDTDEKAPTVCPICEYEVDEELSRYRGYNMCLECVEALQGRYEH